MRFTAFDCSQSHRPMHSKPGEVSLVQIYKICILTSLGETKQRPEEGRGVAFGVAQLYRQLWSMLGCQYQTFGKFRLML